MVKEGSQPAKGPGEEGQRRNGQGGNAFMLKTLERAESGQGWKNACETSGALASSVRRGRRKEWVGLQVRWRRAPPECGRWGDSLQEVQHKFEKAAVEKGVKETEKRKRNLRAEVGDPESEGAWFRCGVTCSWRGEQRL